MIAFIAGTNLFDQPPFDEASAELANTPYGSAVLYRGDCWVLVLRHGSDGRTPPHRINHRANVAALRQLGVAGVVCFCSTGSLRADLVPGTFVVPDDYINLTPVLTFYDDEVFEEAVRHVTPVLDAELQDRIVTALDSLSEDYVRGGVYYQSIGPRLETRAEIRMIARHADLVGMTFGHEATLCNEAAIPVASLCSVHNMAHGLAADETLRAGDIGRRKMAEAPRLAAVASVLAEQVAGP